VGTQKNRVLEHVGPSYFQSVDGLNEFGFPPKETAFPE
jgi:hypothetical protein